MDGAKPLRGNILGDLSAEADHAMLGKAFYSTPDVRSLIESSDKVLVVGRRGTGKSALAYHLDNHYRSVEHTRLVNLAFEEDQVIGMCPLLSRFGSDYRRITAACKIAWRYALLLEVANELSKHFKFTKADNEGIVGGFLKSWRTNGGSAVERLRRTLKAKFKEGVLPEEQIAELVTELQIRQLEDWMGKILPELKFHCVILIDRLDEGYNPDDAGTGLVSGIAEAAVYLRTKFANIRPILFLRDNMFRTMAHLNPDYSRNLEGHVLRLHWDDYMLKNMIANRLRLAFALREESTLKVWNHCVAGELEGSEGFKKCLRLTLYRPRDILALLNDAFSNATRHDRGQIIAEDVEHSAKNISISRLDDLHKEYSVIIPGLEHFTKAFAHLRPEMKGSEACGVIAPAMNAYDARPEVMRELRAWNSPQDVLRALYSVGFIGVKDPATSLYVFCHDGNRLQKDIAADDTVLVHPCFWMALNLKDDVLRPNNLEEIHDEYAITVTNEPVEVRNKRYGQLCAEYGTIPLTNDGDKPFAEWCCRALTSILAGFIHDIKLEEYGSLFMARGLNLGRAVSWDCLSKAYGVRKVVFGVFNQETVQEDWLRHFADRLDKQNGNLAFVVTRGHKLEIDKHGELELIRTLYSNRKVTVVRINGTFLVQLLSKLRNPQKHDAVEQAFNAAVRSFSHNYVRDRLFNPVPETPATNVSDLPAKGNALDAAAGECYGEVDINPDGENMTLRIFYNRVGPGRKAELSEPIPLQPQAYSILQNGIESARQRFVDETRAQARNDGRSMDASECEPAAEQCFEVGWTNNDLSRLLYDKRYSDLAKNQKGAIKTAMSRLRNMVHFEKGAVPFISDPDEHYYRKANVKLRMKK